MPSPYLKDILTCDEDALGMLERATQTGDEMNNKDQCPACGAEVDLIDQALTGYCMDCDNSGETHRHFARTQATEGPGSIRAMSEDPDHCENCQHRWCCESPDPDGWERGECANYDREEA